LPRKRINEGLRFRRFRLHLASSGAGAAKINAAI
jgi:hypothetical protein